MLTWANKKEIDFKMIESMEAAHNGNLKIRNLRNILKAWELSIIYRQIKRRFGDRKDISILDFGAGESPFAAYLNHIGYQNVTCLDKKGGWHPEMNQESYNKRYNANVRYLKEDIIFRYIGQHDVIFSASVLEHIEEAKRIPILRALWMHLAMNGLFIHIVDHDKGIDFKELIDNCGLRISYNPEQTPGCAEFTGPPEYTWWRISRKTKTVTSIAFFNEK